MYSLRYGAQFPLVTVGGLKDTVIDFGDDGNGIVMINLQLEIYVIQLIEQLIYTKTIK
jgi:glycogen synthase